MLYDNRKTKEEVMVEGEQILNKLVGITVITAFGFLALFFM